MTRTPAETEAGLLPDAPHTVQVGGPWAGVDAATWVRRIAELSTPTRELRDGKFVGWINPDRREPAA
jgi:hypothetical protein